MTTERLAALLEECYAEEPLLDRWAARLIAQGVRVGDDGLTLGTLPEDEPFNGGRTVFGDAPADDAGGLRADLAAFAELLEAEWYNGNLDESVYERLNSDLGGIVAKHRAALTTREPASAGPSHGSAAGAYQRDDPAPAQPAPPALDRERLARPFSGGNYLQVYDLHQSKWLGGPEATAAIADAYEADDA